MSMSEARNKLMHFALRRASLEYADPSATLEADMEFCDGMIDEAAIAIAVTKGYQHPHNVKE